MPDERFAIASDHAGVGLKAVLRAALEEAGREVIDLGPRATVRSTTPTLRRLWRRRSRAGAPIGASSFAGAALA